MFRNIIKKCCQSRKNFGINSSEKVRNLKKLIEIENHKYDWKTFIWFISLHSLGNI